MNVKTGVFPTPRVGHTMCIVRERVYVFGGLLDDGELTNETWVMDLDSQQWSKVLTYGLEPSPRRNASICVSEDARRWSSVVGNWHCFHLLPCVQEGELILLPIHLMSAFDHSLTRRVPNIS